MMMIFNITVQRIVVMVFSLATFRTIDYWAGGWRAIRCVGRTIPNGDDL